MSPGLAIVLPLIPTPDAINSLLNGTVDILAVNLAHGLESELPANISEIELLHSSYYDHVSAVVRSLNANRIQCKYFRFFQPFTQRVWITLAFSYFYFITIFWLLSKWHSGRKTSARSSDSPSSKNKGHKLPHFRRSSSFKRRWRHFLRQRTSNFPFATKTEIVFYNKDISVTDVDPVYGAKHLPSIIVSSAGNNSTSASTKRDAEAEIVVRKSGRSSGWSQSRKPGRSRRPMKFCDVAWIFISFVLQKKTLQLASFPASRLLGKRETCTKCRDLGV